MPMPRTGPTSRTSSLKGLCFGDLDGDDIDEIVVFSQSKKLDENDQPQFTSVRVFKKAAGGYHEEWKADGHGHISLWPTGLHHLLGDGRLQIVTVAVVTWSIGYNLNVYGLQDGTFKVLLTVPTIFYPDISDLDGDGRREIVVSGKGTAPEIYSWDGKRFAQADHKFPGYYRQLAARDLAANLRTKPLNAARLHSLQILLRELALAGMALEIEEIATTVLKTAEGDEEARTVGGASALEEIQRILAACRKKISPGEQ